MLVEILTSSNNQEDTPQIRDEVLAVLETFEPLQSISFWGRRFSPLAILLRISPGLIFLFAIVLQPIWPIADWPMFYSGLLASALSLILFPLLMKRIKYTLGTLWDREIISLKVESLGSLEPNEETTESEANLSASVALEKKYSIFIRKFQKWLNSPYQWISGLAFAALVFTWHHYKLEDSAQIGEHLIAFVIGLMAWRMIVIGIFVWQMGREFDIHPQLGHPDECGGLEPLGYLCLWNALLLSILGVFLGGWIILGPSTNYGDEYTSLFWKLLWIPVSWAGISFFLPLWSFHNILVEKRDEVQLQLNQLGQRIDQLSHEILDRCHELEPEESEKMAKKLEILQQTYQQNKNYPVWPFNADLIKKLTLSQTVQVLSLTGLSKPIINGVQIAVEILKGLSK